MTSCPITLDPVEDGTMFSAAGLRSLHPQLKRTEECALPLRGKMRKLTRNDWVTYLCRERLALQESILDGILSDLSNGLGKWADIIERSKLSSPRKETYLQLLKDRHQRLFAPS